MIKDLLNAASGESDVDSNIKPALKFTCHTVYGDTISVLDIYHSLYMLYVKKDVIYIDLSKGMTAMICKSFEEKEKAFTFSDGFPSVDEGFRPRHTEDELHEAYLTLSEVNDKDMFQLMYSNPVFSYTDYRGDKVNFTELAEAIYTCGSSPNECIDWVYNIIYGLIGFICESEEIKSPFRGTELPME